MTPPPERPKFAAVALLVALLAVGCATHTDSDAQVMCEQIVKDRLRSPGTADFSGVSTIKTGDQRTVTGAVDSDNLLGATVRNNFTCVLKPAGDSWDLVSFTGLTN
jgi:hypothetical protein